MSQKTKHSTVITPSVEKNEDTYEICYYFIYMTWRGISTCSCWDLQRKSETKALLNSGILIVYIMGFTREFAYIKAFSAKSKRRNVKREREISKKKKLNTVHGSHMSRDTKVMINNAQVNFFSLLAAPWC